MGESFAIMASAAAGSVRYWAAALAAGSVTIDDTLTHLPLRHSHHRYRLQAPDGTVQTLTIPLDHSTTTMATPMREVRVAEHGRWRGQHWGAIYSAYGRSPFFDYLADDLHRVLVDGRQHYLLDLNDDLQRLIVDWAALPVEFSHTSGVLPHPIPKDGSETLDLRQRFTDKPAPAVGGKNSAPISAREADIIDVPYYQVWQRRAGGFTPNLSVLDLLMNTGREAILTLRAMHGNL